MALKMTEAHRADLAERIAALDTEEVRAVYRAGGYPRADAVRDVNKRYRWDLYRAATVGRRDFVDGLYAYLDDAHIDSALRSMVRPI
jgi:hypothetical protein